MRLQRSTGRLRCRLIGAVAVTRDTPARRRTSEPLASIPAEAGGQLCAQHIHQQLWLNTTPFVPLCFVLHAPPCLVRQTMRLICLSCKQPHRTVTLPPSIFASATPQLPSLRPDSSSGTRTTDYPAGPRLSTLRTSHTPRGTPTHTLHALKRRGHRLSRGACDPPSCKAGSQLTRKSASSSQGSPSRA